MTVLNASTADEMRQIGATIGRALTAGTVVILNGPLGAGKTTLTQGIADGLGVRGPITSPTFVISRVHPSLTDGPALIHVDAYRVASLAEIDDLDLDTDLERAVLVAEWGAGKIDAIAQAHVTINIDRADDDVRTLSVEGLEL
jgi:tRNA threonylcarbamoyladenosine biosynthesis protein TsaE